MHTVGRIVLSNYYRFDFGIASVIFFVWVQTIDVFGHIRFGGVEVRRRNDDWSAEITSAEIVKAVHRTSIASLLVNAKTFVFRRHLRRREQFLSDSKSIGRNSQVFGISLILQIQRTTEIGCESPQFVATFHSGTEHRSIGASQLVAILGVPKLQTPAVFEDKNKFKVVLPNAVELKMNFVSTQF